MGNQEHENRGVTRRGEYADMGLFHPFWDDFFADRPFRKEMNELQRAMRTDIQETEQGYEFTIELPGFEKKDINIGLENGYLTVSAEKKLDQNASDRAKFIRRERVVSACSRSFYVGEINEEAIVAALANGVLTIAVPKEIKPTKKHIQIK